MDRIAQFINNVCHVPLLEDVIEIVYWCLALLVAGVCWVLYLPVAVHRLLTKRLDRSVVKPIGKIFLVTGCDTGFGHDLALKLAKNNYLVYAGVYSEKSVASLTSEAGDSATNLVAVKMDVRSKDDIEMIRKMIAEDKRGDLFALVNNAGIGYGCPCDWQSEESYRNMMDINFFALINITKAFLPMLKRNDSKNMYGAKRIINVVSTAGITPSAPLMSSYAASKHAAQCFTTSLATELSPFNIHVASINPSFHKTPIVTNSAKEVSRVYNEELSPELKEQYGADYMRNLERITVDLSKGNCWDPKNVVSGIYHACVANCPKGMYLIGFDAKYVMPLMNIIDNFFTLSAVKIVTKGDLDKIAKKPTNQSK